jgi:cysteinyl-tRNA synthetase
MMDVLGLDPLSDRWAAVSAVDDAPHRALSALVGHLLEERQRARAGRDFATADALRDRLLAAGIVVEDTPDRSIWTLKDA